MYMCVYIFVYTHIYMHPSCWSAPRPPSTHRLSDGVGTNGVVAEVPQLPLVNFHRRCGQHMATYDNICQNVTTCSKL